MLLITGMHGASIGVVASRSRRRSAAGFISAEWNGADTGSGSARLAPAALSSSQALSTPALVPAMTVCFGSLKLAASTTSPRRRGRPAAQPSTHRVRVEAEDRRHRAGADRHRLLHRLGAKAHQRQRVGEAQRAGGDERGVLAERMAGDDGGRGLRLGQPGAIAGDAGGQHHRLGVGRQVELLLRAFADQAADVVAERGRGLVERLPHRRRGRPRRRACRPTASPGRERRMRTESCRDERALRSRAAPRPR